MNKIKVGAKIKVNAENPTTAHTLARYMKAARLTFFLFSVKTAVLAALF